MKKALFALLISFSVSGCAGVFHVDSAGRHGPYVLACESVGSDYAFDHGDDKGEMIAEICKQGATRWPHELPAFKRQMVAKYGDFINHEDIRNAAGYWQANK